MLIAHKVIDALLGRGNRYKLHPVPGVDDKQRQRVARMIDEVQKFDFGDLMLEIVPGGKSGRWKLPALSREELGYWEQGLIPLPFQACWYEFVIDGFRSGLLVIQDMEGETPGTYIHRIDFTNDRVLFDGILLGIEGASEKGLRLSLSGNTEMLDALRRTNQLKDNIVMNGPLVVYLTMMLNSRTTEMETVQPPKFLNRKRIKKGLTPLPAHRVVRIVPAKYRQAAESEAKAERRLPRLHWRRSHLRHFDHQTGNAKYMPGLMHNGTQGWWVTVIARCLIGKPELGSVEHTYEFHKPEVTREP